jgi:tetratricopeptide (TPR) repeat protein
VDQASYASLASSQSGAPTPMVVRVVITVHPVKQSRKILGHVYALLLLSACSSAPPTVHDFQPPVDVREQEAIIAANLRMTEPAEEALASALAGYRAMDDLHGQWRVTLMQVRLQMAEGRNAQASASIDRLQSLARQLNDESYQFQSAILLGRTRDSAYFQQALDYSRSPLEQALALTYLGDSELAISTIEPDAIDHPADRAFVHYRYAVSQQSIEAMERALQYYKMAEDSRGIADCLMHLARWSQLAQQTGAAREYAQRAQRVLVASGDDERAASVSRWLDSQP